ncbi:hypothetical protein Trydic_g492 [Trypoxylus dichotomus]
MRLGVVVCIFLQLVLANCLSIPDYLPERCKLSDPKYSNCLLRQLEKARPYLVKGIPELKLPALDPLIIPYATVNRTLNELVSINAICKNVKILGFAGTVIDKIRANPKTLVGELSITVPHFYMEMEYEVTGQLLVIPLRSRGYCETNVTNTTYQMRANMKRIEHDGEEFFQIEKMFLKSRVDNGSVKLVSKNPELQFAADIIANFYNENPRLVMDAINPIYVEYARDFFQDEINKGLYNIPAKELLPE